MKSIKNLIGQVIAGKQKALVAFVVATIATFVAKHGFTLDANLQGYLTSVLAGVVAHGTVYLTSNK